MRARQLLTRSGQADLDASATSSVVGPTSLAAMFGIVIAYSPLAADQRDEFLSAAIAQL